MNLKHNKNSINSQYIIIIPKYKAVADFAIEVEEIQIVSLRYLNITFLILP